MTKKSQKIVVAITGASGSIYAETLLKKLQSHIDSNKINATVSIVISEEGKLVWEHELENTNYLNYPFKIYKNNDFFAPFASGSANYNCMIILPCTMGTMAKIAIGTAENLIARAADVMLKERKKLIIVPRETPFNLIHINNMKTITEAGGIIFPASPSFYSKPQNINELIENFVDRLLSVAGIIEEGYSWNS